MESYCLWYFLWYITDHDSIQNLPVLVSATKLAYMILGTVSVQECTDQQWK